jgi:hypothetical protein
MVAENDRRWQRDGRSRDTGASKKVRMAIEKLAERMGVQPSGNELKMADAVVYIKTLLTPRPDSLRKW